MAETLILATKCAPLANSNNEEALFVNLKRRPATLLEAAEVAKLIERLPADSRAGHLSAGNQTIASYIQASLNEGGCASLRESAIADTMLGLSRGRLGMPSVSLSRHTLPMVSLEKLGDRGLLHRDIGALKAEQPPYRGPVHDCSDRRTAPSYPVLWGHDANRERVSDRATGLSR